MKNLSLALLTAAALPLNGLAGALDRPGTATPIPVAPGAVGTNTALAAGVKSLKIIGTVVQKQEKGIVILAAPQRSKEKPTGLVYVEGDFSKQVIGSNVTFMASDSGNYDYQPTPGSKPIPSAAGVNTNTAGQIRKMTFVRW